MMGGGYRSQFKGIDVKPRYMLRINVCGFFYCFFIYVVRCSCNMMF